MPNIREYSAPQGLGLNPSETGIDALTQGARRIGTFGSQVADTYNQEGSLIKGAVADVGQVAVDYVNQKDRSDVSVAATGALAKLDQAWNVTTKGNGLDPSDANYVAPADPNDPTVAQKFMQSQVEPLLEKLKDVPFGEAGQEYAQNQIDQIRSHMSQKLTADMSTMAGEAAVLKDRQTTNNLSNLVTTSPDFHSVDMALSMHKDAAAGWTSNPNITGDQLGRMNEHFQASQEQIVHAAASAAISKARDPQAVAAAFIKRYPDYIKGDEANAFAKAAQVQAKSDVAQDRQAEIQKRQLADLQVHQSATKVLTDNVSVDPTSGNPVINPKFFRDALDIAKNNPNAPSAAATARTMLDWGQSQQNKEGKIVDDPAVRQDLTDRLFSPDNPTTRQDLMKAQIAGKLSDHSFQTMERLVTELEQSPLKGPVWAATAAAAKDALIVSIPGMPGKDSKGAESYSSFMQSFIPQYLAKSRAGTLPPNALDVKDPNSMISQAMAPFKRTPGQRQADWIASVGGLGGGATSAAQPTRKVGDVSVPSALNGIAALQYNSATRQWRDSTSGTIYDSAGNPVKR